MGLLWNRWAAIRTESGARIDLIDRLEAYFRLNGIKARVTFEDNRLKRLHVLKKEEVRARQLLEVFDSEL